jgi:hypothetical protein
MRAAPEKRKPTSAKVGSLELSKSLAASDTSEINPNQRQAQRLCSRFSMSWPLACVVASLAYGEARP